MYNFKFEDIITTLQIAIYWLEKQKPMNNHKKANGK